jgi:hypothetical protein
MNKRIFYSVVAATFVTGTVFGAVIAPHVLAAAEPARDGGAVAAKLGITAYETDGQAGGGGAPEKALIDNDVVRVNLVSFPAGFNRPGRVKRRYNQVAVYIDQADFTITWNGTTAEAVPADKQRATKTPQGGASFHAKDSLASDTHVNSAYRVIFVEMKR